MFRLKGNVNLIFDRLFHASNDQVRRNINDIEQPLAIVGVAATWHLAVVPKPQCVQLTRFPVGPLYMQQMLGMSE